MAVLRRLLTFGTGDLPPALQDAVRLEQDRAEVWISVIQLAAVVLFGTLYAVARKTFPADAPFEPVPWVLGAYGVFSALRLALALRTRLPGWFVAASVFTDIALLMGLIFSFHIQYTQEAAFYLKAPTLMYVFIFIALRSLRFEPGFILLAGIAAAAGWAFLLGFALTTMPETLTNDYVAYMTSNKVLLGAEIDKIVTILAVTVILAVAMTRARAVLVRAVREATAARSLSRFFAPEVADHIRAALSDVKPGQGAAREAAILTLDIRGFTTLSARLDPDTVMRLLTEYQAVAVPVLRAHGGVVDKFLGDGILVTFGAATDSDSYAADALRAAENLMAALDAWASARAVEGEVPLRFGCGIATGRVVFGAVGTSSRLEYTVIGDAVNTAAKLEKTTKALKVRVLTTRATLALAVEQGHPREPFRVIPAVKVDGVEDPVDLAALD